eukprot:gene8538-1987_t
MAKYVQQDGKDTVCPFIGAFWGPAAKNKSGFAIGIAGLHK